MANEITITTNSSLTNGSLRATWNPGSVQITQSTASRTGGTESLTTSESTFGVPTSGGLLFMRNIGTTNAAYWGPNVGGNMATTGYLAAGDHCFFRTTSGVAFRGKSAASTTSLVWEYWQV